jgi:F0F1-type ATP synthase assembly protein I
MSPTGDQQQINQRQTSFRVTLVAVVAQVGCLTFLILLVAVFGGLWLDKTFNTQPMFTVGLTIISALVSLVAILWIVRNATSRLESASTPKTNFSSKEETNSGKD